MGVFAALIFPTTLSIITNTFSDRRQRAIALGGWGAVVGVGVAAGPVTGGLLLEHFSWSSVFWALVPLALLAAVLTYLLVPESRDPGVPALDIRGLTTSIALLGVLVYTIIEAPARGWHSQATVFGFAATAALAMAFVMIEQAAEHPMLDIRLFTDRRFSAASASVTVTFFSLSGFIFLITQYFQVLRGFSPLVDRRPHPARRAFDRRRLRSRWAAGTAHRHPRRGGQRTCLLRHRDGLDRRQHRHRHPYWTTIVPQMLLMGLGIGLVSTPATESIMLVLPPARAGIGSAVNDATRELGSTLGVAIIGSLFSSFFGAHLADSAFAATGKASEAADSVQVAFGIATNNPTLLAAAQHSFLAGLTAACTVIAGLCYTAAAVGIGALPGRRFKPSLATTTAALSNQ